MAAPVSLQGNKPHRNSPEPSEPCLLNLRQHTPEPSEIFQNLPPEPTILRRNSPELSGTRLRNLHQHTPELSGTFRNPPPEPTPFYAGTLRNLPEPSSGTCSCGPHRHTPELIWAEAPISLRCWGKTSLPNLSDASPRLNITCWTQACLPAARYFLALFLNSWKLPHLLNNMFFLFQQLWSSRNSGTVQHLRTIAHV